MIEEDNKSVSERVLSFVVIFAEILLLVTNHREQWTTSQIVHLQIYISIDSKLLMRYIKSIANCKNFAIRNTREPMKTNKFCIALATRGLWEEQLLWHTIRA